MKKLLLHITHTDIRSDSRILKELRALEELEACNCMGIGVELDEGATSDLRELKSRIVTLKLLSRLLSWLPRPIRYGFDMIELTIRLFFRGFFVKPSVVHCHDTMVLPAGLFIKLFTGCKLVYDAHELESNKKGQSRILSKATLAIERWSWSRIDLLISVSESILTWYDEQLGSKPKVLVLNSPEFNESEIKTESVESSKRYFHDNYGIQEDKLVFVYLGILSKGRGIEATLEVFSSKLIDAHVVYVGYGELSESIQAYSDEYENIHLHAPVPHNQVVSLVRSADVGLCLIENVSLSDYYSLPNKLFEYSFAGLHVLASDFPEIRKVVNEYAIGTCCSLESDEIHKAVSNLAANPPPGIKVSLSALSWKEQAVRLSQGYKRMLS